MSVVIRGMEMPRNCDECPCYYETEGAWRNECEVLGKEYIADDYRPEWCPLVELPAQHGRLIDADALPQTRVEWDDIVNAPTVIEAEGASE